MIKRIRFFSSFHHYMSMNPRERVGRAYVGDYSTLLYTEYLIRCGPIGFREDFLKAFFLIIIVWKLMIPGI